MNAEINVGSSVLLTIKKLGINGEGIAYYKRKAVFIPNAIPGEVVEVEITKNYDTYCYGKITSFKTISKARTSPPCEYFGKCGGCQLQHIDYKEQLNLKRQLVVDSFEKYLDGNKQVLVHDCLGMENNFYYRNKTQLPARHDGEKIVVGIYEKDSNRLVHIESCMLENKLLKSCMDKILEYLTKANIDVYNPRFRQGNLRYIILRAFEETNEAQVTFVLMKNETRIIKIFEKCIDIPNIKSVNYTINNDPKSVEIITSKVINIAGKKLISGKLKDLVYEISPDSFYQLNSFQTVNLYEEVLKALNPKGNECVVDLCCGIGSIGSFVSKSVKEVRGIDINISSIENARTFALKNNLKNLKFYCGNIVKNLIEFEKEGFNIDAVIIDPPRKGIELSLLNYFQKSKIKKIIYVSCNPSTLSKNINHLQRSYNISYIKPIDMFPHTSNVETVTLLLRK